MRLLFFAFFVSVSVANAQVSYTLGGDASKPVPKQEMKEKQGYSKVMVIPFESKLYMSEIDRDIANAQDLSAYDIRTNFRHGLTANVFIQSDQQYGATSLLSDDAEVQRDLMYVYKSIGYKYKEAPVEEVQEEKQSGIKNFAAKLREKIEPTPPEPGTRIENGQIVSYANTKERFMATSVMNPHIFSYLEDKYGTDLFIFINQLDIKIAPGTSQHQIQGDSYSRQIKVHYSIFDSNGNEIYAGAAKQYFPSYVNNMNKIVKTHFAEIAKQITSHLPALSYASSQSPTHPKNDPNQEKDDLTRQ